MMLVLMVRLSEFGKSLNEPEPEPGTMGDKKNLRKITSFMINGQQIVCETRGPISFLAAHVPTSLVQHEDLLLGMDRGMGNPWGSWVGVPRGMGMGRDLMTPGPPDDSWVSIEMDRGMSNPP